MIFALVILAVAAIGLAGSVYVMGALVEHTVATQEAVQRRLTLENSKALAVQFIREKTLQGGAATALASTSVLSGTNLLGTAAVTAPGSVWSSTAAVAGANYFSPAGDTALTIGGSTYYYPGYGVSVTATLSDGVNNTIPWTFEVRTRTPTLGYDLLSLPTGGSVTSFISSSQSIGTMNGPTRSGDLLNSAFPPDISRTGDLFTATGATSVALTASGTSSGTAYSATGSALTVFLNAGATKLYVTGTLTNLTFSGTDPYYQGPIAVVYNNNSSQAIALSLPNGSQRRLYVAFNTNGSTLTITPGGASAFRLAGAFLNTPVVFSTNSNVNVTGGFRTNRAMTISGGGSVTAIRETDPDILDTIALRRGWVETYRQ